jgi:hypothetical protein
VKKFLLPLVLLAGVAHADSIPATADSVPRQGSFSTSAAVQYGVSGANFVPMAVSSNGSTIAQLSSVTALTPSTMVKADVAATTALVVNLTTSAGVSGPCMICLASNGGAAAGFKVQFGMSATAPVNLTASSVGAYVAASTTSQCWGPWVAGTHAYMAGVAAVSSVLYDVQAVKNVAGAQ